MRNAQLFLLVATLLAACSSSTGSGTSSGSTSGTTTGGGLLGAGKACSANAACSSGVCGINGTGNCCSSACATSDAACGASACDAFGSCTYPPPVTSCGANTCVGTTFTPAGNCNGQGVCHAASPTACTDNLGCVDGGVCAITCASSADCAPNFVCNGGTCTGKVTAGVCTENDDCSSGFCGVSGSGHCCAAQCTSTTAPCGAADCDATSGACVYPDKTVPCGSVLASCTGSTQQDPSLCDGAGNCNTSPGTRDCLPFVCGATACLTSCTDSTSCVAGDFCDVGDSTCCPGFPATGAVIAVDATSGSDSSPCCGLGAAAPCATLTKAMKLIDAAQAQNVTITATVGGTGGDWAPTGEVYPILLGWGVELKAGGVYFNDTTSKIALFDIGKVSASDTVGAASILGSTAKPVWIGIDSTHTTQSTDASAIQVESGNTLYLAGATVNGNPQAGNGSAAITVIGGGSLALGQDQTGTDTGPVVIGGPQLPDGYNGIVCTSARGLGCTITDAVLATGTSAVTIQNQEGVDIDAEDNANITLTSAPIIGVAPNAVGFLQCPSKEDSIAVNTAAVLLKGSATVTFKNGTVSCIAGDGFLLEASVTGGIPALTLDSSTVENTELGVYASAGTATVTKTTLQYNYYGAEQDAARTTTGTVSLGGGGNVIICSNSAESEFGGAPGACVVNTTAQTMDATSTTWDTSTPDLFQCDSTLTSCTCQVASCTTAPGSEGMDAVYENPDGGTITTTGNLLQNADCTVPIPPACDPQTQTGCPPGQRCCGSIVVGGQPFCSPGQICPG